MLGSRIGAVASLMWIELAADGFYRAEPRFGGTSRDDHAA
jgi:hypothetical protein